MAGRIPEQGRLNLSPRLSQKERLREDFTISCLGKKCFQLTASYGSHAFHMRWFEKNTTENVEIENISDSRTGFQIAGHNATALLKK